MSIKFKQNGQWVKIPTPSQIDDSVASATTTYSSNKINEIIPQDIAKYLLEHKDELGTDDFTKLKNVPFTTINITNKSEFTTLKGILDHPDGMYLVDDCGATDGDAQLTIAPFKGHCSTILMASIAQFQQVMDSEEIGCYKGSTIYILTGGDISKGATRYVSIYNVPAGVSGEGSASSPDRTFPDAGTSVFRIEVHPVEDRSHYPITYSYDIDGGTETYFTIPTYESMLSLYAASLVAGSVVGGEVSSSFSPGQLVKVIENKDAPFNSCIFTGVDASEFKSPFTLITNENATNYNTLDKLCHLDDGLYLCKDTYKANQDYIVDITFKGINLADAATASFTGTQPNPDTNGDTKCKNGAIISVVTQEGSTKNKIIRITHGLSANISTQGEGFEDIYIVAKPDDSSTASTLVYGVTGENVQYYRPFGVNTICGSLFPLAAMSNSLMGGSVNGKKMAVWDRPEGADMPTLGFADIPTSPIIEVNDSNWSNFDTLQKWFEAEPGVYYINCTPVRDSVGNIKSYKSITAGFTFSDPSNNNNSTTVTNKTIKLPYRCYIYVNKLDDSGGGWYRDTNVYFPFVSDTDLGSGMCSNRFLNFSYSKMTGNTITPENINMTDFGMIMQFGQSSYGVIFALINIFNDLSSSDVGKVVKVASGDDADSYKFQAVDITLIGNSTSITPAQVLAAVNEGKTTTITHTDATHGTFKFTSFGVVSTTSGDTVSSSITYGTSADSLTLYTLIGDVTNGTWTLYSKNLTVSA